MFAFFYSFIILDPSCYWAGPVDSCVHGLVSTFLAAPRQTHRLVQRLESESLGFCTSSRDDASSWKITKHVVVPVVQYLETHNERIEYSSVLNIRIVVVFFTDWVVRCLSNLQSFASGKLFLGRMFFLAAEKARQFATAAGSDRSYSYRDAPVAWFLTNRYFERWRVGICEPTPNFGNFLVFF